jgi:hypothetical protein
LNNQKNQPHANNSRKGRENFTIFILKKKERFFVKNHGGDTPWVLQQSKEISPRQLIFNQRERESFHFSDDCEDSDETTESYDNSSDESEEGDSNEEAIDDNILTNHRYYVSTTEKRTR